MYCDTDRLDSKSSAQNPSENAAWRRLYEATSAAVVKIETDQGNGSGFFVENNGQIATAAHVVQDAKEVFAITQDGKRYRARLAKLSDTDDLAILRLIGFDNDKQKYLSPGVSDKLKQGDVVYSVGFPSGRVTACLAPMKIAGTVTSFDLVNKAEVTNYYQGLSPSQQENALDALARPLLKTDRTVLPGQSGAPLIDEQGKFIGLTELGGAGRANSFYLPAESVGKLLKEKQKFDFIYERERSPFFEKSTLFASFQNSRSNYYHDRQAYKESTNTHDAIKYGLATISDGAFFVGSKYAAVPSLGLPTLTAGLLTRLASELVPNRVILESMRRLDGSNTPAFNWSHIAFQ